MAKNSRHSRKGSCCHRYKSRALAPLTIVPGYPLCCWAACQRRRRYTMQYLSPHVLRDIPFPGATGAVYTGGRTQGHRVGLADQAGQVGESLGGGGVKVRPVSVEGGGGGGSHQAWWARGEWGGGELGGGLTQQHLQDVVDHVACARASFRKVVLGKEAERFAWEGADVNKRSGQFGSSSPFIWNFSMSIFSRSNSFSQY